MTIPRGRLALMTGALVALGALGGAFVQAATTTTAGVPVEAATTPASGASATAAASDADTALLLDTLALMRDPTSGGAAVPAQLLAVRDRIQGRIANIRGHLVHGSLIVVDRDGALATYQLDHGTVSAVGPASLTIAEAGGSVVTVSTSSATRVRKDARPATLTDLKAGDEIIVRSIVSNGSATAKLVVVVPPAPATSPPSSGNG